MNQIKKQFLFKTCGITTSNYLLFSIPHFISSQLCYPFAYISQSVPDWLGYKAAVTINLFSQVHCQASQASNWTFSKCLPDTEENKTSLSNTSGEPQLLN